MLSVLIVAVSIAVAFVCVPFLAHDPALVFPSFKIFYPYLLLLTPHRAENLEAWSTHVPVETRVIRPSRNVPEILAKDYSYESIRIASRDFRLPVETRTTSTGGFRRVYHSCCKECGCWDLARQKRIGKFWGVVSGAS
jgi:hypothetical protein